MDAHHPFHAFSRENSASAARDAQASSCPSLTQSAGHGSLCSAHTRPAPLYPSLPASPTEGRTRTLLLPKKGPPSGNKRVPHAPGLSSPQKAPHFQLS